MKKLFDKIQSLLGDIKPLIEEYKYCFSFIVIGALFILFLDFDSDFYGKFSLCYYYTVLTIFFIETFSKNSSNNIVYSIFTFIINYVISSYIIDGTPSGRIIVGILGVYFLLGFLSLYEISLKEDFSKYLLDVFSNSIIVSVGSLVIQLGLIFIIFLITHLLFDNLDYEFYLRLELLYLNIIVLPGYILSLLYFKRDFSKLLKHLLVSIIVPLLSISLIILYIYLFKIVILMDIPKNYLFLCVSLYLMVFFPTWFMLEYYENDSNLIKNLRSISFYTFIPLWFVQVYTMGIRILNNGITISRYFAVMIIIFEVFLFYFIYTKKKEKYSSLFLLGGVLVFISLSVPLINSYDVSYYSQISIIKKMVTSQSDFDNLYYEDQSRVVSSVNYIKYSLDMEDKLDDLYKDLMVNKYDDGDYNYNYDHNQIYYTNPNTKFSTNGYDTFSYYDFYVSDDNEEFFDVYEEDKKNRKLENAFYKYIDSCIKEGEVVDYSVELDDDTILYIDYLSLNYYTKTKKIDYLTVRGYLFHNTDKKNN